MVALACQEESCKNLCASSADKRISPKNSMRRPLLSETDIWGRGARAGQEHELSWETGPNI